MQFLVEATIPDAVRGRQSTATIRFDFKPTFGRMKDSLDIHFGHLTRSQHGALPEQSTIKRQAPQRPVFPHISSRSPRIDTSPLRISWPIGNR